MPAVDAMPVSPRTLTLTEAAKAFEAWETAYRENPQAFIHPDVTARSGVSDVSHERAVYFMQLLHFNGQK